MKKLAAGDCRSRRSRGHAAQAPPVPQPPPPSPPVLAGRGAMSALHNIVAAHQRREGSFLQRISLELARLGPRPDWLHVRSWWERTWRLFRGTPFLPDCKHQRHNLGARHRCCITLPNPGVFDDRPPFLGVGLHERTERRPQIGAAEMFGDAMVPQSPQSLQCLPPQRKCFWVLGNME